MAVPYTFGSATTSIPLSQLDSNFATTITLGNTAIQLGNTVTTLNNMTLANTTISSGNATITTLTAPTHNSASSLTFQTNGTTTAVTIDTSQNVGIGVTNPSSYTGKFQVATADANGWYGNFGSATTGVLLGVRSSTASIGTNGSNNLKINPDGGNVTFGSGGAIRSVNFGNSEIAFAQATTGVYINLCDASGNNGSSYNFWIRGLQTGGSAQATLASFNAVASLVYNGSNTITWNTTSDARIKKNIVDNNVGLENILKVRVRNFEYRTADEIVDFPPEVAVARQGLQKGVIAQEYQQAFPDRVHENSKGVLGLDTDETIWDLVNAIKELKALVDAQAIEISELKAKVGV